MWSLFETIVQEPTPFCQHGISHYFLNTSVFLSLVFGGKAITKLIKSCLFSSGYCEGGSGLCQSCVLIVGHFGDISPHLDRLLCL